MALVNSLGCVVRKGDHQGLDQGDGRERWAEASTVVLRTESEEANHWSSCADEGWSGDGGTCQSVRVSAIAVQSASCHLVQGWSSRGSGSVR